MRVAAGAIAALAVLACANVGDPPGGPPDVAPPVLVAVRPESGSVVPALKGSVAIQFDEVIAESPGGAVGGGGSGAAATGLSRYIVLSPVAGPVDVGWHRSRIDVKPKEGWKPNRVYRLELRPGIADLRRNLTTDSRLVLFSTGPALPGARLAGTALQWVEQRALANGVIEAVPLPDSVGYVTLTDSAGKFRLDGIPAGGYVLFGWTDPNSNRRRDRREAYDSILVRLDTAATVTLWAFVHDTAGARLRQAEPRDSLSVLLTFAQALDPAAPLALSQITMVALPDSTPIRLAALWTTAEYDSVAARSRAAADSARRAADTARAAADTMPRRPGAQPLKPPPGAQAGRTTLDTAAAAALRSLLAERPVPSDRRVLRVAAPLAPGGRYLIRVRGARNLSGAAGDGQAVLAVPETPKPAAPDSTRQP